MPQVSSPLVSGRLGYYNKNGEAPDKNKDLNFVLNPSEITRERVPSYAMVQAALVDYADANYPTDVPEPVEWIRNTPERISFDLLMVSPDLQVGGGGNAESDIDADLLKLDKMMQRDKSGQPPLLIFSYGKRADKVRIMNKRVREMMHTPGLKVKKALVHIELICIRPGR